MTAPASDTRIDRTEIARRAAILAIVFLWAQVPLVAVAGLLVGGFSVAVVAVAGIIGAAVTALWRAGPTGLPFQLAASAGLAVDVALFVHLLSGHPWQIDAHMYFFAAIALTAVFCDWRPVVTFAAVTAVHHLVLNFVLPAAVFPGGADFGRVVLHAVVVVVQGAALVWLTAMLQQSFALSDAAITEADRASAAVREAAEREARSHAGQTRVVRELSAAITRLSSGDLTARIDSPPSDPFPSEYEALRRDFNAMGDRLGSGFARVAEAAGEVRGIGAELHRLSSTLAARTEQQAATLEESSAALTQLTQSVHATAGLANEGSRRVAENETAAHANMALLVESVEAIRRAEAEARKIGDVIGLIDDIAFQTNLLALNAGVEAARAEAEAREIRQMIVRSLDQVANGSALVQRSGDALEGLVTGVQAIAGQVVEIANGAQQQARGLSEISSGIGQLDRVTQENAAIAEESQAAADMLRTAADQLIATLADFRFAAATAQGTGQGQPPRAAALRRAG